MRKRKSQSPPRRQSSKAIILYSLGKKDFLGLEMPLEEWLARVKSELKPSKKFASENNAYGHITLRVKEADFPDFFFSLTAKLSHFLYLEKLESEAIQYQHFYTSIAAKDARNEYFFPGRGKRKLVVSDPDECISLLQVTYDDNLCVVNAHIRSTDFVLFPWDLLFILSVPFGYRDAGDKDTHSKTLQFSISFANLHRGNRSPGRGKIRAAYSIMGFIAEIERLSRFNHK